MDAKRVSKHSMKEMIIPEKLEESMQKFALYSIDIC